MLELLVVILCLLLNSFFAAFEMAFVTITKDDLASAPEKFNSVVKNIYRLKKNPERTLSVIQIGISLVAAISAAVGGTGAVAAFSPYLENKYDLSATMAEAISVIAVILPLTYISVVFGELVPKTIALHNPRPILFFGIRFLIFLDKIFSPLITFLENSTEFVLSKLGINDKENEVDKRSSITISYLPQFHQKFVVNLIELHGQRALEAMVRWNDVVKLNFADEADQVRTVLGRSSHTRFPVMDNDVVVGILHVKEFHSQIWDEKGPPWQALIRPVQLFKSTEKLLNIFVKLQEKRQHLAIISDKEGVFLGIITLEDIIEEIVGDIYDEVEDQNSP